MGDYCNCKRCPCCGKLVREAVPSQPWPVPLVPYDPVPSPFSPTVGDPIWVVPLRPSFTWQVFANATSGTVP